MEVLNTNFPWGITTDRKVKSRLHEHVLYDLPSVVDSVHYDHFKCMVTYEVVQTVVNELSMNFHIENNGKDYGFEEFEPLLLRNVTIFILTELLKNGYVLRPVNFNKVLVDYRITQTYARIIRKTTGRIQDFKITN